jgi:hypothetical protein
MMRVGLSGDVRGPDKSDNTEPVYRVESGAESFGSGPLRQNSVAE